MSNQEVRINVAPEIELHAKRDELMTSPQEQAAAGNEEKDNNGKSSPPQDQANDQSKTEYKKLYKAALKDDWKTAYNEIFKGDPSENSKYLTARISEKKDTALHIAVAAESSIFAKKLVKFMQKDDLAIENDDGNTAFFLAAASGMMGLAKIMVEKNEDLPGIRGVDPLPNKATHLPPLNKNPGSVLARGVEKMLPIHIAAKHGHEKMVEFLFGVTKDLTEEDKNKLQDLTHGKDLFGFSKKVATEAPEESGSCNEKAEIETSCPQDKTGSSKEKAKTETSRPEDKTDEQKEKLYRAASGNDNEWYTDYWDIFEIMSKHATDIISDNGDIALHIAAQAGSSKFISILLSYMEEEQLEIKNDDGNTAFYLAAKSGTWKCAKVMYNRNTSLPNIRGDVNMLPIRIAAQNGHKEMVKFLYNVTNLSEDDCKELLPYLVSRADFFGVAWDLLEKSRVTINLSNLKTGEETVLHVLARTPLMSHDLSKQNEGEFFKSFFNKFSYMNKLPHEKLPEEARKLLKFLLQKVDCREKWMHGVIHDAVSHENIEFLSLIMCQYPEFMNCKVNGDTNTSGLIFSTILKNQKEICKVLKDIRPSFKKQILNYKDGKENNILHLAGKLSPPEQLDVICGVALQLQHELLWFKEVSNIVDPSKAHEKNRKKQTPQALFDKEHKQLKERGERWMKDTANSCMIVATLIATVVFAAAFTVPGGTKEESGMPRFANNLSFRIFVLADTISLVLSVYSLLIFLAIHTSRYAEKDFLWELPKKLVVGLLTLLLSIAAMMVVFCTIIFIVFEVENIWLRVLLSVSAALPVIHFAKVKWHLLFDVACSTYKTRKPNKFMKIALIYGTRNLDTNFKDLVRLSKKNVVKGLPNLEFPKGKVCGMC